jgi:hypothetical protein
MNACPRTFLLPVGGELKVTHRVTRSLRTGELVGYVLASRPLRVPARAVLGDRIDLAGTYWWDRRPMGGRR